VSAQAVYPVEGGVVESGGGAIVIRSAISQLVVYANGTFAYQLLAASSETVEVFRVLIANNDVSPDKANITLSFEIVDDFPVSCNDTAEQCHLGSGMVLSGNVMSNDDANSADAPTNLTSFTYRNGTVAQPVVVTQLVAADSCVIVTTYLDALLTVCSNGAWSYLPSNASIGVASPDDSFGYTITDLDGSSGSAVQTINCTNLPGGNPPPLPVWPFVTGAVVALLLVGIPYSIGVGISQALPNAATVFFNPNTGSWFVNTAPQGGIANRGQDSLQQATQFLSSN